MLSPKIAPERIAPASSAGDAPIAAPAVYRIGNIASIVPREDPVASAIAQVMRNVIITKTPPPMCASWASQTKPADTPVALNICASTPTSSMSRNSVAEVREAMPSIAAFQNVCWLFASQEATKRPMKPTAAIAVRSSTTKPTKYTNVPTAKISGAINAPSAPTRNSRRCEAGASVRL